MQMFDSLNKFLPAARGSSLIEFGFLLPMFMLLAVGFIEVGRAYFQANAVEKGVRAGALYAARHTFPLTTAISRLRAAFPGTMAAPCLPPLRIDTAVSSRSFERCRSAPWHT